MSKSKSPDDMEHTFTHVEPSPPSYHEADSEVGSFRVLRPFSSSGLPPSTEERADKLRAALRQRLLDYRWRRKPINVLLLGPAGVGKSCFLNSAIRAFRKEWGQYVQTGGSMGVGRTNITAFLRRVSLYDPGEDDPDRLGPDELPEDYDQDDREEEEEGEDGDEKARRKREKEERILRRVSVRFVDVCGLPNENNHVTREVLRRLLYGAIPVDENVLEVHALGDREGAAAVRAKYPHINDQLAIDRVVVVNAANMEVPKELIQAVLDAAQPITQKSSQEDGITYRRAVPTFGLITKADLVQKMGDDQFRQYEQMKNSVVDHLALRGAETRFGEVQNYYTELGQVPALEERENDPRLDCTILQFIYDLADPAHRVDHGEFRPDITKPEAEAVEPEAQPETLRPEAVVSDVTPAAQQPRGTLGLSCIIVALSVYIGVLLQFNVLPAMISTSPVGFIPAAVLTLAPILFLVYVVYSGDRRFI